MTFEEKQKDYNEKIMAAIFRAPAYRNVLCGIVNELDESETIGDFDSILSQLLDAGLISDEEEEEEKSDHKKKKKKLTLLGKSVFQILLDNKLIIFSADGFKSTNEVRKVPKIFE